MAAVQSQAQIPDLQLINLEKLEDIIKKQEEEVRNLETKAIQLLNLYFVFQGVVLSSISSVTPVKCHNWWIPFCLSLIATLLNFISIFSSIRYYLICSEALDQTYEDFNHLRMLRHLRTTGDGGGQANGVQLQSYRRDHQESVTRPMLDTRAQANDVQLQSSQSEEEGDQNRPIPFRLSLIAALLNFISIFGSIRYFLKCSEELDQNYEDVHEMRLQQRRTTGDGGGQANGDFPSEREGDRPIPPRGSPVDMSSEWYRPMPDPVNHIKNRILCYAAMGLLLGFSCIILYSCRALLCDCTPTDKCVKLC